MPNQIPLQVPVPTRPTPEVQDVLIFEDVDTQKGNYVPVPYGSDHADTVRYPGYKLCKETQLADNISRRWWATEFVNQDIYNGEIIFDGEENSKPSYPRRYIIRRDKYNATSGPLTKATALTGVWMVKVTLAGSGYDPKVPPAVTFSGGAGSGAAARAVVNELGAVCWIVLTAEGASYTSAPTVAIAPPTAGVTALATAYIQSASAALTREKMSELPDDDPRHSIFVQVDRLYETLPGAILITNRIGEQGATETIRIQKRRTGTVVVNGDYLKTSEEVKAESTVVDIWTYTVVDEWPILTDYDQDPEHLGLIVTTMQVVDAGTVVAPTAVDGIITRYKHIDKFRSMQIIEDFTAFTAISYSEQRFMAHNFPSLFDITQYAWSDACGAFSNQRDGFSAMVKTRLDVTFSTSVQTITGITLIPNSFHLGHGVQLSDVLNDAGSFVYSGSCTGTITVGASSPSYSYYIANYQNTFQLISGESVRSRFGGLYRNSRLYVYML